MATRLDRHHSEPVRQKIRTSQLINRLESLAFGEIEMTPSQVRAIEVLLKKTLPDLSNIEVSGENGALKIEIVRLTDTPAK